jgi:hypothetical protein
MHQPSIVGKPKAMRHYRVHPLLEGPYRTCLGHPLGLDHSEQAVQASQWLFELRATHRGTEAALALQPALCDQAP